MTGMVEGKVAFITGAARGQGRAHAVKLAEHGARIIAVDICESLPTLPYPGPTTDDLAETVRLVEEAGSKAYSAVADVRDLAQLETAVSAGVDLFGRLDVVVANAGIMGTMDKGWLLSEDDWDATVGVNLTGVFLTIKATMPHLLAHGDGGSVILTSSMAGLRGVGNIADYTAAKHGLVGLARSMAIDAGELNVRFNTVHPGSVPTPLIKNDAVYKVFRPDLESPTWEDCQEGFDGLSLLPGAVQEPEDIANAVLWLASDLSRMTTGTTLSVDGGASYR
jgi:(+)-trans-carveol dehydrogenase